MDSYDNREEDLFIEWLELSPEDRKGFIDTVCMDDPDMRSRLLELIKHFESTEDLFQVTPEEDFSEIAAEVQSIAPSDETAGDQIGRYLLREKIGEGAWGSVWLAQQTGDIDRLVALKILKLGLDTKDFLRRFEAERQMLAMMEHPSIATIHDAGSTEYGRPYLVMELVRGKPMLEFAEDNKMTIEERVELYIHISQALDHAHDKGVIHRDIKPSNILIAEQDDGPVPKVIDFGVAKTNQIRLGEKRLFTSFHTFTGTPLYSSPEQLEFSGQIVDRRSDVYSLGVLLYEFLTGVPPYDHDELTEAGLDGMRKIVRETDPPIPSRRFAALEQEEQEAVAKHRGIQPAKIENQLKGDLDWIIMKCLEKDRKRRYQSARALVEDLRAFLDCRPISAAAPSVLYRTGKFIRRNRVGPIALAVIPATLLCIVGLLFYVKGRNLSSVEFVSPYAMALKEGNRSVAVLPFKSFSEDDAFIAAGLHGELTNEFARIPDLRTIARESTLRYRDTSKSLAAIGKDLGVITVVTGDVQRMGDNVRINVQLIDVLDNRTLWGDSYTRVFNPNSFFDILTEISTSIMDELGSLLSPEDNENDSVVPTQNLEALAAFFKGDELMKSGDLAQTPEAIELFEKAIELDPEFVEAYVSLAGILFTSGVYLGYPGASGYLSLGMTRQEAIQKISELKERAFEVAAKGAELDENLLDLQFPFIYNSMHRVGGGGVELDESLLDLQIPFIFNGTDQENVEFTRAFWERYIEERPNDPHGYAGMAYWHGNIKINQVSREMRTLDNLDWIAALERTYEMWQKATELDPASSWHRGELARYLKVMGRSDEHMEQLKLNVYHNPNVVAANEALANELVNRSRFDEAMIYLRKSFALGSNQKADNMKRIFETLGDNDAAAQWAERMKKIYPRRAKNYEHQILRLRGEEMWVRRSKDEFPENTVFRGPASWTVAIRNYDLHNGHYEEQRARYYALDTLFFNPNVVELVKAGEPRIIKERPTYWCIIAMELTAFLIANDEQEQADRLLEAASYILDNHPNPDLWRMREGTFFTAPGNSRYLFYQAINLSLRDDKKRAVDVLREAVDHGFSDRLNLNDARFDSLREEPGFIELMDIVDSDLAQQLANIRRMEANGELAAIPKLPAKP